MNSPLTHTNRQLCVWVLVAWLTSALLYAEDWPMFGRDRTRNPVSPEKNAPVE